MNTIFILTEELKNDFTSYQVLKLFFNNERVCIAGYRADIEKRVDKDSGFTFFDEKYVPLSNEQVYKEISQISEIKMLPYNKFDFSRYFYQPLVIRTVLLTEKKMLSIKVNDADICIGGERSLFRVVTHPNKMKEFILKNKEEVQTEQLLELLGPGLLERFSMKAAVPDVLLLAGRRVSVYPQIIGDQVALFAKIYSMRDKFLKRISSYEYVRMLNFHRCFEI